MTRPSERVFRYLDAIAVGWCIACVFLPPGSNGIRILSGCAAALMFVRAFLWWQPVGGSE